MKSFPASAHGRCGRIFFPEYDHIARAVDKSKTFYERPLLDAIRKLRKKGTYIDVGAHVGNHTLFFSLCCPARKIIAIESDPETFQALALTCSGVNRVDLHNVAAMDQEGAVCILRPDPDNRGMNQVQWDDAGMVCAQRLDALVNEDDVVLIKLDVEGTEVHALRGATRLLEQSPVLVVESRTPLDDRRIATFMSSVGYRRGLRFCKTPTYLWLPCDA